MVRGSGGNIRASAEIIATVVTFYGFTSFFFFLVWYILLDYIYSRREERDLLFKCSSHKATSSHP